MESFDEFFRGATGAPPYGYQSRLAREGLPPVVEAPTGTGKTGIILAWLWRRLHGPDREGTPRRLVYALPQRSLVEQVAGEAERWLANLGLAEQVALHVVMGGAGETQRQWRLGMHLPAIVVGTVDSLVSKALNRGYGIARAIYPIDFALVTNGAHWVVDEIQLCPESATTVRQLAAFARSFGTAEPFGLTCMSATVPKALLDTVDNPAPGPGDVVTIEPSERTGELAARLDAERTIRRLAAEPGDYPAVADAVAGLHQPGTLTLVIVNTVAAARDVYKALRRGAIPCTLLHSRFRARERAELVRKITSAPGQDGHVVVATQVVEAGIDLNASALVTEAAPWPSVVQRAGRCNRTGQITGAALWWLPPANPAPYPEADIKATAAELEALEGEPVTSEGLLARRVAVTEQPVTVLRRPDLVGLFDTAPDLSGGDLDIAPYVRDADDLDVQLAWATWTPRPGSRDGSPPAGAKAPPAPWRCRVPLGELAKLAKRAAVWRLDQVNGRWTRVDPSGPGRARPGEVLVMSASDGGYDPETGFDPAAKGPVPGCPVLGAGAVTLEATDGRAGVAEVAAGMEDAFGADTASLAQRDWVSLRQHSEQARDQAEGLLAALRPVLPGGAGQAAVAAAYLHDAGKAHPTWQDALCALAPEDRADEIASGRPWAKSASDARLRFAGDVPFRHELASLLLIDGPLRSLLDDVAEPSLVRYLVLAHHGRLRIQVRDPGEATPGTLLGLEQGKTTPIPAMFGLPASVLTVDLNQFSLGGERSWTRDALVLRDRYGPFVLAYLETLVRVADWRASAGTEVPR
ncbi:MAG TPA: CRISPR-associated helicase Cas3' [Streptosporangiaceae bacterium]|nr:CRISPR-associated helicase Cas3' [Streptosporangiaceae bacterium]